MIQLGRAPNRIDLLTQIWGLTFEEAWASRVPAELDGLEVFMIGQKGRRRSKRATARTQDLADAEKLEGSTPRGRPLNPQGGSPISKGAAKLSECPTQLLV